MSDRIVVVGGVACGPKAAARARRRNPDAEIVIIERGEHISYAGCGLPYYVGGTVGELVDLWSTPFNLARDAGYFEAVKDIDVRLFTEATRIDREAKCLHLRHVQTGEEEVLEYGKLVLATGGTPIRPPVEGLDLGRVFCMHVPSDAARMRELIEADEVEAAVIIGGGSIGIEAVESLFAHAVDTAVVEMQEHVLPGLLDPDMAAFVQGELRRNEVEVFAPECVVRAEGDDEGNVCKVVTDQREIACDMVLVAAGVAPNVGLAREAGLEIGATGAMVVNERMQTSDPAIYAGGDCVESTHRLTGEKVRIPLGSTANKQGRVIGTNLTGGEATFPGVVGTAVLKSLGLNIARTGLTMAQAKERGYDAVATLTPSLDRAHYYPGGKLIFVRLIAERGTEKLLGGQVLGAGDVVKRTDALAAVLTWGGTLADIADLDLAYAPPFSTAVDPIAHAANQTRNQLEGLSAGRSADELQCMLDSSEEFVLLDLRQPSEMASGGIEDPRTLHVPMTELRQHCFDVPKDQEFVVLCQSGLRGYEGCTMLESMGFTNVRFLEGGLKMWLALKA